jgi:hypothetical protein
MPADAAEHTDAGAQDSEPGSPQGSGRPQRVDSKTEFSSADWPAGISEAVLGGKLFSRSGLRAHVQITVGLSTLLGLDEEPGDLAGHGPVSAQTARDLAFGLGSTWRRLVTDPLSGALLDYGRTTYRPPAALADHVRARDVTCRTPNCTRPATSCDLDHVISWPAGATSENNLQTKCDIDHRLKHEGGWRHQISTDPQHPPGTVIMISPTGHVYVSHPHDYTDSWSESSPGPGYFAALIGQAQSDERRTSETQNRGEDAAQHQTMQSQAVPYQSAQNQRTQKGGTQNQGAQHKGGQHKGGQHEVGQHEGAQNENAQHEDARNGETPWDRSTEHPPF